VILRAAMSFSFHHSALPLCGNLNLASSLPI